MPVLPASIGGFSYDLAPLWMKEVVGPCIPKKDGKMALGLCDGYGWHTTLPMVEAAESIGVVLQLRVPHTSHVSQVADVAKFKRNARQAKSDLPVQKVMAGEPPRLTSNDMLSVVKQPWEEAFHPDVSRKGWKRIGFDPATKACNRLLYWQLNEAEDANAASKSRLGRSDIVLDTRCLEFAQAPIMATNDVTSSAAASSAAATSATAAAQYRAHESQDNCESESQDSGDSDCEGPGLDTLRLGGEDFRLGPLTYGAGRAKLDQRQKRKAEELAKFCTNYVLNVQGLHLSNTTLRGHSNCF